ncbi:hypothetical protein U1Q18_019400 [Sarracenia purpurea var. burkii]
MRTPPDTAEADGVSYAIVSWNSKRDWRAPDRRSFSPHCLVGSPSHGLTVRGTELGLRIGLTPLSSWLAYRHLLFLPELVVGKRECDCAE